MGYSTLTRAGLACAILILVAPVALHASTYQDDVSSGSVNADFGERNDTLFVTTQGTATLNGSEAKAIAIDTDRGETVWSHARYERYFDIEPLSDDTVLFLGAVGPHGENMWVNIVNWRTGELRDRFRVPDDVHDVDPIGDGRYAVADIDTDRAYVYDARSDDIAWEYRFREHFPPDVGGDESDYTHLNDIDVFDNGSTFLVSPRNFDRVLLLNRSEKRIEWTLGEEDNDSVLHEQHNPALLSRDPPVVLVADSENDRIVEYRKTDSGWETVWAYSGSLTWPRDADRLPNGNTLVVDSNGQRVLEVTPGRDVVWEVSVTKNPYDADLLSLGDEPRGPPMTQFQSSFDGAEPKTARFGAVVDRLSYPVELVQWVVPWTVRFGDFLNLLAALALAVFATGGELRQWRRERGDVGLVEGFPVRRVRAVLGLLAMGLGGYLLVAPGVEPLFRWLWRGIGVLVAGTGAVSLASSRAGRPTDGVPTRVRAWAPTAIATLSAFGAVGLGIATGWLGLNLGTAAALVLEASRHAPTEMLRNRRRLARAHALGGYLGRFAVLAPAILLVLISAGENYELAYLGVSALLACTAAAPHGRAAHDARRTEFDPRAHVRSGFRAVAAGAAVVAAVGFGYLASQPTRLALAYAGLALVLLRTAAVLIATATSR
ncbi:hypothetical protein BRC82_09590 [Halobacteriales archaeon QS_1_67_19]|nr:MAG: hypothetical protein BRC82_09590 [Halobacteriales archaeon QS_1_67_19]